MKNIINIFITFIIINFFITINVEASVGTIGFFGGTSEGKRLYKTTENLLNKKILEDDPSGTYVYKEVVFLGGEPSTFEGILVVKQNGKADKNIGSYKITFQTLPNEATKDTIINRNITFKVNYRKEKNQTIKDFEQISWIEDIKTKKGSYSLDKTRSNFGVSIIEDKTPGVIYSKGNISQRAVYKGGESKEDEKGQEDIVLECISDIYSYNSPWSSTETHRTDGWVYTKNWQMNYQVRPTVSVNKILQYSQNEPNTISFEGNYREVMQNQSGINYNIILKPQKFYYVNDNGKESISTYNTFEQLIAPDTSNLKGHFAENDIKKLYSMQIFSKDPQYFKPNQVMTRGEYIKALTKAIRLPIEDENKNKNKNKELTLIFPDVLPIREEYPYIMAAYDAGLSVGKENANFNIDEPINRQEAIVFLVRALGVENLELNPTVITIFKDDNEIDIWAKREVEKAFKIGIIYPDEDGNFKPKENISKGEGAALINRLIEYMRKDLVEDYTEKIINYGT